MGRDGAEGADKTGRSADRELSDRADAGVFAPGGQAGDVKPGVKIQFTTPSTVASDLDTDIPQLDLNVRWIPRALAIVFVFSFLRWCSA